MLPLKFGQHKIPIRSSVLWVFSYLVFSFLMQFSLQWNSLLQGHTWNFIEGIQTKKNPITAYWEGFWNSNWGFFKALSDSLALYRAYTWGLFLNCWAPEGQIMVLYVARIKPTSKIIPRARWLSSCWNIITLSRHSWVLYMLYKVVFRWKLGHLFIHPQSWTQWIQREECNLDRIPIHFRPIPSLPMESSID